MDEHVAGREHEDVALLEAPPALWDSQGGEGAFALGFDEFGGVGHQRDEILGFLVLVALAWQCCGILWSATGARPWHGQDCHGGEVSYDGSRARYRS
jgi:hypothetical protein